MSLITLHAYSHFYIVIDDSGRHCALCVQEHASVAAPHCYRQDGGQ